MTKQYLTLFAFLFFYTLSVAQKVTITKGMTIKKSTKFKKGAYTIDAYDSLNRSVILIEGNNIVVDFNNAVLNGNPSKQLPNKFYGVAVIIRNGKNITIKNLTAKGYKIALMARNVNGLKIDNCDFSYNYRQHLNSTQEKEDISDWMSYHHNENDEWLRYGAAMYLKGCNNFTVRNTKVTGGQNALMLMECNRGNIYNNDFSFNSGIGIGMYKSSGNTIMYNKVNFNVRGYSHGVYNRGQDSAGILVYEQSNGNLFYKNSVTHGGDGFFLWAGQTTMDTGQGGCNDNRLIENDFSFAPTNGIEVTFSRNIIMKNQIYECDHGIWGGYSYHTAITGNQFRNNRIAIAIEHGQHNQISDNIFFRDKEAIRLWSRPQQPSDWGYAKYRDARSVDYVITLNSFNQNPLVYNFSRTDSLKIFNNSYTGVDKIFKIDSTVTNIDSTETDIADTMDVDYSLKNMIDPFKGSAKLAGRKNIMITEWGPYDFRYPILWHTNPVDSGRQMNFKIFGPKGKWKIVSARDIDNLSKTADSLPSEIWGMKNPGDIMDIKIIMEFTGEAFIDQFGKRHPANKPYRFSFIKFFQPINFTVNWYAFDSTTNPLKTNSIEALIKQQPFKIEKVTKIDYAWWGGIKTQSQQQTEFLTVAEGSADLESGDYELGVTWDDAVRVYIDDSLVVDEWNPSKYKFDESPNKKIRLKRQKGNHAFRLEHVELGGLASLSLKLKKIS